tara:strand:- start:263 stop:796 length:534 start_codon:yes stop_codon:yes gene_type:complete
MIPVIESNCFISKCKEYRWNFNLRISFQEKKIVFIGLNPSHSDGIFLDNTTKKILNICSNNNYGEISIINLFGLISHSPKNLLFHKDPIGYLNNKIIKKSLKDWSESDKCDIWLGWGNNGDLYARSSKVYKLILKYFSIKKSNFNNPLAPLIIRKTKKSNPIHPLYCKNNSALIRYI